MTLSLLHRAISQQRTRQFDLLIAQGISIHQRDVFLRTPLHMVNELQDQSIAVHFARVLLEYGARINVKDSHGHTPFYNAVINQRLRLVKLFLKEREVDFLECDKDGNTPLHFTAIVGDEAMLTLLVKAMRKVAVSLDVRNDRGETPLMLATKHVHCQCQTILQGKSWKRFRTPRYDIQNAKDDEIKEESALSERFRIKFPEICGNLVTDKSPNKELKPNKEKSVKEALPNIFNTYKVQLASNYRPPAIHPQPKKGKITDHGDDLVLRKRSMSCGSLSDLTAIREDLSKGNLKKMPTDLAMWRKNAKKMRIKDAMIRLSKQINKTRSLTK